MNHPNSPPLPGTNLSRIPHACLRAWRALNGRAKIFVGVGALMVLLAINILSSQRTGGFREERNPLPATSPLSPSRTWHAENGDSITGQYAGIGSDARLQFAAPDGKRYSLSKYAGGLRDDDRTWLVHHCDDDLRYVGDNPL